MEVEGVSQDIASCLEASPLGSEQPSKNEKKKGGRGGGTRCPRAVALQLEEKEEKVEEEEEEEEEDEDEEKEGATSRG
ncbi:hypothetical protein V1477_000377 [Vespula maculifrons]|uniref:Uncharacterized protein n=1 Tax=Vespula maculifrons TaxID=7453 RepID=A0ABD2D2R2_VESMC